MLLYRPYLRERALAYARRWALGRNPLFYDFTGIGGDCTSFVSQCILAGSCVENPTPGLGWYYRSVQDRAPAFTGVRYFWSFMTGAPAFRAENGGVGPFGREVTRRELQPGDVIQLGDAAGEYYHTLLAVAVEGEEVLVAAHSNDAYYRRLSSYDHAVARYLHLEGVRQQGEGQDCFPGLLSGTALPEVPF